MAEFKIGRLRFTWSGAWATGTVYRRDSVVEHDGKAYVCLEPHTSTEFNDDLAHVTIGGAITPYWSLMVDGKKWRGPWTTATAYNLNNIVLFGGTLYYCDTAHTSTAFETDSSNWTTLIESYTWHTAWQTNRAYGVGDVVKYGAIVYRCIAAHTSAPTTALGLEDVLASWEILTSGVEYVGVWANGYRYRKNDLVRNGPDLYICSEGHTASSAIDPLKWTLWMPGFEFANTWSSSTRYQPGDVVNYGGYIYASISVNNQSNTPSTDAVNWSLVTTGYNFRNDWGTGSSYKIGDVVRLNGILYEAIADSTGQNPALASLTKTYTASGSSGTTLKVTSTTGLSLGHIVTGVGFTLGQSVQSVSSGTTLILNKAPDGTLTDNQVLVFVGLNSTYWKIISPSIFWRNVWTFGVDYRVGDLVVWKNSTYLCIDNHNSGVGFRPDLDINTTTWVEYIAHARNNALQTLGDVSTYSDGQTIAVAIGTQDYTLRATDNLPAWKHLNSISQLYYVDKEGTDTTSDGWGLTWDKPWKTIKFACDTISAGTQNLTVRPLLENNKLWLTTEMYQWMLYQVEQENAPFTQSSTFDEAKTKRDAGFVVDALIQDIIRESNSFTTATASSYFSPDGTNIFVTPTVTEQMPYFVAALEYLKTLIGHALVNTSPASNYQAINNVALGDRVNQTKLTYSADLPIIADINALIDIVITALDNQDTSGIPALNQKIAYTVMVKTGTYAEQLPITVPANTAIVGDELRSVVVEPLVKITTDCTSTSSTANTFVVTSTDGMEDQMPVQFAGRLVNNLPVTLGGVTNGQTYYIVGASITATEFSVTTSHGEYTDVGGTNVFGSSGSTATFDITVDDDSYTAVINYGGVGYTQGNTINVLGTSIGGVTPENDVLITVTSVASGVITGITASGSTILPVTTESGLMTVYAGDCVKDMFYLRNATGLRNMTVKGLLGTLSEADAFTLKRPTGGAYASLDPGNGPGDTNAWIYRRSPYVQNVTAFGTGCSALKIDGYLHNGGNKSIVANDFTHILSDGIGVWCTGPGALTEVISVFSYYGYAGYLAEAGGRIRAANGNSSYGVFGVVATGYDTTEVPSTGSIDNQSSQVQASVQSAFGTTANLLRLNYSNAGSGYNTTTTNLLSYSNNFLGASWASDGNVLFSKNTSAPSGLTEGWSLTGITSTSGSDYLYQNISIPAAGRTYTGLTAVNITGSGGTGLNPAATFDVTVTSTAYIVTVNTGGGGYVSGNQLLISGGQLGGVNSVNDCLLVVDQLAGSVILTVVATGVVPTNSDLNYTISVYVKTGTAPNIDLQGIFSGSSTVTSGVTYNSTAGTLTASNSGGGLLPVHYGLESTLIEGWSRLWLSVNDTTGLNTQLQFRLYPRGVNGNTGTYNYFYGGQVELSQTSFTPGFYLEVAGTTKYTAYANYNISGAGTGVITVGDEIRSKAVFNSRVTDTGIGAGGNGYLTSSNNSQVGDTTFVKLAQSDTNTASNYTGMRVFINSGTGAGQYGYISYFDDATKDAFVLKESFDTVGITNTTDTTNLLTIDATYDTSTLYEGQPVQFIPTYYNTAVTATSLSQVGVSASTGGTTNTLTVSSSAGLRVGMGITFTAGSTPIFSTISSGYVYYVNNIVNETTIQITEQLFGNVWPLTTASGNMIMNFTSNTSYVSASTLNMVVNYPVQFTGIGLGGITVGQTYYINDVIDIGHFTISNALVDVTVVSTDPGTKALTVDAGQSTTNLIPLNPISFSTPTIGGIVDATKYYISKIIDSTSFTISSTLISRDATRTYAGSNLIEVQSTSGFIVNNPIQFVGTLFGGISPETIYYILAINDGQTFTVSQTPGGGAIALTDAIGSLTARTAPAPFAVTSDTGSMSGTTTAAKTALTLGTGAMNATFSTSLFGGVDLGTIYYVDTIDSGTNKITVSATQGSGIPITLSTKSGSMNLAEVGWDHINIGTPISGNLDSSSIYYIEPRTTFSKPEFSQDVATDTVTLSGSSWTDIAYGKNYWIAIANSNSTAAGSDDGDTWVSLALPTSATWSGIAYGNGYWVIISTGGAGNSVALYSKSNGYGWRSTTLPAQTTWNKVVYGNGVFVAIATGTANSAYSTNYGATWATGTGLPNATWTGLSYGNGIFVAVASGGTQAAYSTDGINWTSSTLPSSTTWSSVAFGNNLFHAISSTSAKTAYTFNGATWYESNIAIGANKLAYGQGVFLALSSASGVAYTTEGDGAWEVRDVTDDGYGAVEFGYTSSFDGVFVTLAGVDTGSIISAGARAKGRAIITSNKIVNVSQWESGSGYQDVPTVTFTDPNVTSLATVIPRLSNGTLGNPGFVNRGLGYNTNSTSVIVTGNGFADTYQTGLTLRIKDLTNLPNPGDNLTIDGVDEIYKVTSASIVYGTVAPNLQANVQISPAMTGELSPANGATVSIRSLYSQARLTNHDFLNVGYGDFNTSNYPGLPDAGYGALSQNQTIEVNFGRVFYTSTDQDGNFKVGNLFGVQQATGIVTLSASQFGLTGLETLSLGGIAVGGSSVIINSFSTDGTFTANSDSVVPTQKAIKTYLTNRLSQGGSNTFTGQFTAGTVVVGGPNKISSTVPNGFTGSVVKVASRAVIRSVDGDMAALDFFMRNSTHKTR